ncbi:DUF4175 domain-containing protein [Brevundimonas sp. Leaf363]|uniref:DUF4175 domain-containing protein n=1 Tax=Brevundimonas sp. Leaf363 TaxID=1736353 RepID=UPI000A5CBAC6|nr:DUF4175 domain-containing protein [Brevundimonas sp. Leaf363]
MIRRWLNSTFGWPVVLGVLSLVGLVGALLWDGAWDEIGAVLLGASIAAVVWARTRRP